MVAAVQLKVFFDGQIVLQLHVVVKNYCKGTFFNAAFDRPLVGESFPFELRQLHLHATYLLNSSSESKQWAKRLQVTAGSGQRSYLRWADSFIGISILTSRYVDEIIRLNLLLINKQASVDIECTCRSHNILWPERNSSPPASLRTIVHTAGVKLLGFSQFFSCDRIR